MPSAFRTFAFIPINRRIAVNPQIGTAAFKQHADPRTSIGPAPLLRLVAENHVDMPTQAAVHIADIGFESEAARTTALDAGQAV